MKKVLLIIFLTFCISGCDVEVNNNMEESEKMDNINVIINDEKYILSLEKNETSLEFIKMLPKEFKMNELNGNEKYIYLDFTLPSNSTSVSYINKGDVMLFNDNCLVIFYKSFETSYSYTKIGHIDNLPDLGNGNVVIRFEK